MQHCLFAAHLAEAHDARGCGRPCTRADVALRGRVGAEHPLAADARCRNTLFSGRAQSAVTLVPEMRRRGIRHFRLELLRETPRQAAALLDLYAGVLSGDLDPAAAWQQLEKMHPAGVTRGTWDFQ
jgi:putative protease